MPLLDARSQLSVTCLRQGKPSLLPSHPSQLHNPGWQKRSFVKEDPPIALTTGKEPVGDTAGSFARGATELQVGVVRRRGWVIGRKGGLGGQRRCMPG